MRAGYTKGEVEDLRCKRMAVLSSVNRGQHHYGAARSDGATGGLPMRRCRGTLWISLSVSDTATEDCRNEGLMLK